MNIQKLIADLGTGIVSGYVGTRLVEPVGMKLYELESEEDRKKEDSVRPGEPYTIAAQKTLKLVGIQLKDTEIEKVGMGFHYGLGMSWGAVYVWLHRLTKLNPFLGGLLTGFMMWLLVDEGVTPTLGFSAPNNAYPLATHIRGFIAHLVFGLGVALCAQTLTWLGRNGQASKI